MTLQDYALAMLAEDITVSVLARRLPLAYSSFAARTGVSELPPVGRPFDRAAWARRVVIDDQALSSYARAVGQATDAFAAAAPRDDSLCVLRGVLCLKRRRAAGASGAAP
jgi:hypothetical protein